MEWNEQQNITGIIIVIGFELVSRIKRGKILCLQFF